VSIHLAKHLGFSTHGVDFFEPFVENARSRAVDHEVQHLCSFELADARDAVRRHQGFDVAVCASIGGVLGDHASCIGQLRRTVRPGGYLVLDDGFLAGTERPDRQDWGHYVPYEETLRQIRAHGDDLVQETRIPPENMHAMDQRYLEAIARRASDIADRHPELADALARHVEWQREEGEAWETHVQSAVWLLRRT
jgi:ubiquinone/menaquinone biosynthesis C-methylase UbiE